MIIRHDGQGIGSVGGGSAEGNVISRAVDLLGSDLSDWVDVKMWGSEKEPEAMVCGGRMKILLEPLTPREDLPWINRLIRELEEGRTVLVARTLQRKAGEENDAPMVSTLYDKALSPIWIKKGIAPLTLPTSIGIPVIESIPDLVGDGPTFLERVFPPDQLVIVGGGHIAHSLCEMARLLGFFITVLDDRAEFASRDRFPAATEVLCGDYATLLQSITGGDSTYFALVAKSYKVDIETLPVILEKRSRYIGMIGSSRRIRTVRRILQERGIPAEDLDQIHAPIGLDIGAVTPTEIAASIAAQLVSVRHCADRNPHRLDGTTPHPQ